MNTGSAEPFADNWSYLKAELQWLDRVLMLAVARQRKETKAVERVAQSGADRATSHWWKGLIALDGAGGHDDSSAVQGSKSSEKSEAAAAKVGYQKQIESRIQVSHQRGVLLGIPSLCDRLQLTTFEKNLLLLVLAPEINRRYTRLYSYLQSHEGQHDHRWEPDWLRRGMTEPARHPGSELPSVDLVLRLFCRNDAEWRSARSRLTTASPLIHHQVVELVADTEDSFLGRRLRLGEAWVNYFLGDHLSWDTLENLLGGEPPEAALPAEPLTFFSTESPLECLDLEVDPDPSPDRAVSLWTKLILPIPLKTSLQHLSARYQQWEEDAEKPGLMAVLIGESGTGKTLAAHAIAQTLQTQLVTVDLALLTSDRYAPVIQSLCDRAPKVLLIQSAQHWLGRSAALAPALVQQFLAQRQAQPGITLLSVRSRLGIQHQWRQQISPLLEFPLPDLQAREQLWQQAFAKTVSLVAPLTWEILAKTLTLTGGEIQAIALDALSYAALETPQAHKITVDHIWQACEQKFGSRSAKHRKLKPYCSR